MRGRLPAGHEWPAVEVEMIVMRGIEFRAERNTEIPARCPVRLAQKPALGVIALPIPRDPDALPVGELEPGDIDGVGGSVLTAESFKHLRADDVAASKSAHVFHALDRRAEKVLRERLQIVRDPQGKSGRHFACQRTNRQLRAASLRHAHGVFPPASVINRFVVDRSGCYLRLGECRRAKRSVAPKGRQTEIDEPRLGYSKIQAGQRIDPVRHNTEPQRNDAAGNDEYKEKKLGKAASAPAPTLL